MADSASASSLEDELKGIYDDPDYGLFDNMTKYMSMRFESRDLFLESLDARDQDRISREMDIITKLRTRISVDHNLIDTHLAKRKEWKTEARSKAVQNLLKLDKRRIGHEHHSTRLGSYTRHDYLMNEERILRAISRWPEDSDLVPAGIMTEFEDSETGTYGMEANIMHFRKGRGGYTHNYKHREVVGQFPNQEIDINYLLADSEDNPLKEVCAADSIRYFHLPSNNMDWVEVG